MTTEPLGVSALSQIWRAAYAWEYEREITSIAALAEKHGDMDTAATLTRAVPSFILGTMAVEEWDAIVGEIVKGRRGYTRKEDPQ